MNIEMLEKVARRLERMRHKQHFQMPVLFEQNECGTSACIAGHICLMNGYVPIMHSSGYPLAVVRKVGEKIDADAKWDEERSALKIARRLLGLTEIQANRLFNAEEWPVKFGGEYVNGRYSPDYFLDDEKTNDPKVAAARIRHFVKTKGRE